MWNYIKVLSEYKLEICNSIHTRSNKWRQKVISVLAKQKIIYFLKYIYYTNYIYIYMYTKAFLLCLIKAWERTSKKNDGETGKHKLNETKTWSTEHEIEKLKQTR